MNVLIVDDQVDVVRGLLGGIDWQSAGIAEAFGATSAAQARAILESKEIGLLLCDIEMPEQNGLELFRWAKDRGMDVACIFLTAHAEFAYAKEALELGSISYILQPASYGEILAMVRQAVERIRQRQAEKESSRYGSYWRQNSRTLLDNCVRLFLTELEPDPVRFRSDMERLDYKFGEEVFQLVLLQLLHGEPDREALDGLAVGALGVEPGRIAVAQLERDRYAILYPGGGAPLYQVAERLEALLYQAKINLGTVLALYTALPSPLSRLPEAYRELEELCRDNVAGYSRVFLAGREQGTVPAPGLPDYKSWGELITSGGIETVRRQAHDYLEKQRKSGAMDTAILAGFHQDFSQLLLDTVRSLDRSVRDKLFGNRFDEYLRSYSSLDDMHAYIDYAMDFLAHSLPDSGGASAVERAVDYINRNLDKNPGRAEIAEAVFLNPEYLSRLFKKEMGISLVDYAVKRKMELACSLLRHTAIPVYLIASKAGYTNYSYFSKVFKKQMGVTPQEYRAREREKVI